MRLLLDTNVFLWSAGQPERLSPRVLSVLQLPENEVLVSAVTAWEIAIRLNQLLGGRGSLVDRFYRAQLRNLVAQELPIAPAHALATYHLPLIHRDPFDRMLVAQAQVEGLVLLTNDARIAAYDVETIW